jgi:hypothetical protein
MNYDTTCLWRLVSGIPISTGRSGFPGELWRLASFLDEYSYYLPMADHLRVQRLDSLYMHARCLVIFDDRMFDDLIESGGWRGLSVGAWLAALKAEESCRSALECYASNEHQAATIRLALNELNGHTVAELTEAHHRIERLRAAIGRIPVTPFKLRAYDPDVDTKIELDREQIAQIYATQGAKAASVFIRSRPWSYKLEMARPRSLANICAEGASASFGKEWHWGFLA